MIGFAATFTSRMKSATRADVEAIFAAALESAQVRNPRSFAISARVAAIFRSRSLFFGYARLSKASNSRSECRALRELQGRQRVGIRRRDLDLAVGARLVPVDVVLGKALQLRRVRVGRAHVVGDRPLERGLFFRQVVAQLLQLRARRIVLVDAPEPVQDELAGDVMLRRRIRPPRSSAASAS